MVSLFIKPISDCVARNGPSGGATGSDDVLGAVRAAASASYTHELHGTLVLSAVMCMKFFNVHFRANALLPSLGFMALCLGASPPVRYRSFWFYLLSSSSSSFPPLSSSLASPLLSLSLFLSFFLSFFFKWVRRPALQRWQDLNYLDRVAGGRSVPVELGRAYTDDNWQQRLMPLREFLDLLVAESQRLVTNRKKKRRKR